MAATVLQPSRHTLHTSSIIVADEEQASLELIGADVSITMIIVILVIIDFLWKARSGASKVYENTGGGILKV